MRFPGRALPWVLFLLALAIRIASVEQYRANPLFARPIIDARTSRAWALRIATGRGFGEGAFTRAPGYPAFLAAIYGASEGKSLFAAPAPPEEAGRAPALAPAERAIVAAKRVQA